LNTQTRRQREFEQREQLFIDTARSIIRQDGHSGLTMDKIAELTEYAKGTVYKHFTCKEDILCGLCLDSLGHLHKMFSLAETFQGTSREQIMCLGIGYQLYTLSYPEEFDLLIAARTNNIREKASPERLEKMKQVDNLVINHMRGVIDHAVQCGDLQLPKASTIDDICYGLWAMNFGLLVLDHARDMVNGLTLSPSHHLVLSQISCLLDGYNWQPLSTEKDYSATIEAAYNHLHQPSSTD